MQDAQEASKWELMKRSEEAWQWMKSLCSIPMAGQEKWLHCAFQIVCEALSLANSNLNPMEKKILWNISQTWMEVVALV